MGGDFLVKSGCQSGRVSSFENLDCYRKVITTLQKTNWQTEPDLSATEHFHNRWKWNPDSGFQAIHFCPRMFLHISL